MLPSMPSDVMWNALDPLFGQLELLERILSAFASSLAGFAALAAGLAVLLVTGLMLSEAYGDGDETVSVTFSDESVHP